MKGARDHKKSVGRIREIMDTLADLLDGRDVNPILWSLMLGPMPPQGAWKVVVIVPLAVVAMLGAGAAATFAYAAYLGRYTVAPLQAGAFIVVWLGLVGLGVWLMRRPLSTEKPPVRIRARHAEAFQTSLLHDNLVKDCNRFRLTREETAEALENGLKYFAEQPRYLPSGRFNPKVRVLPTRSMHWGPDDWALVSLFLCLAAVADIPLYEKTARLTPNEIEYDFYTATKAAREE